MKKAKVWLCGVLLAAPVMVAPQTAYAKQVVTCTTDGKSEQVEYEGPAKEGDSCGRGNSKGTVTKVEQVPDFKVMPKEGGTGRGGTR